MHQIYTTNKRLKDQLNQMLFDKSKTEATIKETKQSYDFLLQQNIDDTKD